MGRISSKEFSEWIAYERIDGPLGMQREDYHAAYIAWKIVLMLRDPNKGRTPTLDDMLLKWGTLPDGDDP